MSQTDVLVDLCCSCRLSAEQEKEKKTKDKQKQKKKANKRTRKDESGDKTGERNMHFVPQQRLYNCFRNVITWPI